MKKKTVEETFSKEIGRIDQELLMARGQTKLAGVRLGKAIAVLDGVDNKNLIQKRNAACEMVKNKHCYTAAFDRQRILEQKKEKLCGQKVQMSDYLAVKKLHEALARAEITAEKLVGQKALEAGWDEAFEAAGEPDKAILSAQDDEINEVMNEIYGRPGRSDEVQDDEVEAALRAGAR